MGNPSFTDDTLDNVTTVSDGKVWRPMRPIQPIRGTTLTNLQNRLKKVEITTGAAASDPDTPKQVANVIAVESPSKQQDRTFSAVSVQFTRDASDNAFAGVKIWLTGYKGNSNPVLVADGADSPITFLVETTHEVVLVTVQTFGTTGKVADFDHAPTASVQLDGVISAPPAPSIAQSLVGTPLGYQFSFNQLAAQIADVIQAYRIYRNTTNTSGTASLIQTIPHDPTNAGSVVVTDTIVPALGTTYFYWVSAVNTSGLESTLTAAQSGPVVGSIGAVPPSFANSFSYTSTTTSITWTWLANQIIFRADGTVTLVPAGSVTITGLAAGTTYYFYPYYDEAAQVLKFLSSSSVTVPSLTGVTLNGTTGYVVMPTSESIGAAGNPYSFDIWFKTTSASAGGLFDLSSPSTLGTSTATAFQLVMNAGGTLTAAVWAGGGTPAAKTTTTTVKYNDGSWHYAAVTFDATNILTIYVDGVQAAQNAATGAANGIAGFLHFGAVAGRSGWPATVNTFFNGTISHAAFYNEVVLPTLQSTARFQAAVNSGQALLESIMLAYAGSTGQLAGIWYLTDTSGSTAAIAFAAGATPVAANYIGGFTLNQSTLTTIAVGTPADAWPYQTFLFSQAQSVKSVIPLSSGAMPAATPSSGSGGGSGGGSSGGGRGGCFSGNTLVKTQRGCVPISEINVGDQVLTAAKTWRPVLEIFKHDTCQSDPEEPGVSSRIPGRSAEGAWLMCDMGNGELITVNQSILAADEWKRAYLLFGPRFPYFDAVFNLGIDARTQDAMSPVTENSFTLANGHVAHNVQLGK